MIPWEALFGGMLLGLSATLLLLVNGKIAGISGIVSGLLSRTPRNSIHIVKWRGLFLVGMVAGGALMSAYLDISLPDYSSSMPWLFVAGFLVGVGTKLGNGCTSGHGICGIGRLSKRSMVATGVFMAVAMVTVFIRLHILG